MKKTQQDDSEDIVELLTKDYLQKSKADLNKKIGEIAQDHINRGLFSGTGRIGKQLQVDFENIDNLIDYIITSLRKEFAHIQLDICKDKLIDITESEYKKLIPKTNARLVGSNLTQKGTLQNFENVILKEMKKAKEKIEVQFILLGREKAAAKAKSEKWYQNRTIQAALITGVFMLITALITTPLWIPFINKIFGDSGQKTKVPIESQRDPNSPMIIDQNASSSKRLKDEKSLEPEEREADVNRPKTSPIFKIPEKAIAPEETNGEVNEQKRPEFIKRKEKPIEPEDQ